MSEDFVMPTTDVDQSELDSSGFVDKEGYYHFEIQDVVPELDTMDSDGKDRSPCFLIKCIVIHNVEGQSEAGKLLYHRLYVGAKGGGPPKDGAVKSVVRFMTGIGAMEWKEASNGKTVAVCTVTGKPAVSKETFSACKGRQFIGKVAKEEGTEKYKAKYVIPFSEVYLPGDPKVDKVPYNKSAWAAKTTRGAGTGLEGTDPPDDF